jgi:uncharacterized integral membrane protein (TIGR00697 family)
LAGEFFNSVVLSRLKVKTGGRNLWMRTIGSTIVGEGVDTVLFIGIAFWGTMPAPVLLGMMAAQYLWKVGYEALLTPLTYIIVNWVKRKEQMDVYDTSITYNPFSLEA